MMQLDAVTRLLPSAELPRYTYVPGSGSPHPIRDPRGHSHNRKLPPPIALDPETWAENRWYLWAIDLFNLGYYWEAHEEWERLLRATGADSTCGRFLKGLIKLAAAGVKVREHSLHGVRRHAASAGEVFADVAAEAVLQKAQSVEPSSPTPRMALGNLYERRKQGGTSRRS